MLSASGRRDKFSWTNKGRKLKEVNRYKFSGQTGEASISALYLTMELGRVARDFEAAAERHRMTESNKTR
jgi:hypothetical protein